MALTPSQVLVIDILTRITSLISVVACLVVILAYPFFPPFRNSISSRLALTIAIADVLSISSEALGRLGPAMGNPLCLTQAMLQQFGELLAIFVITGIALNLVHVLWFEYEFDEIRDMDKYHIAVSITLALVFTLLPLLFKDPAGKLVYGPTELWCWITTRQHKWFLYGPLSVAVLFCAVVYVYVSITLKQKQEEDALFMGISVDDPYVNTLPGTVAMYLTVFILTWSPMLILQVYKVIRNDHSVMGVDVALTVFLPLRGFTDSGVAFYQAYKGRKVTSKMQRLGLNANPNEKQEWWVELDAKLLNRVSTVIG